MKGVGCSPGFLALGAMAAAICYSACSSETTSRDPASISAEQSQDGRDKDGEGAQVPTNIAGAFLVSPDMRSCLNEVKAAEQSLVSMCGVVLKAEPLASEQGLSSKMLDKASKPVESGSLTLKVYAESAEKAVIRSQSSYIADNVVTEYGGRSVASSSVRLVHVDDTRLMIYVRSSLANVTEGDTTHVKATLKIGEARFETSKESIWKVQPDAFSLDKLFLDLMLQAGLKVSVAQGAGEGALDSGSFATESLKIGNVASWLSAASIDWDVIMEE